VPFGSLFGAGPEALVWVWALELLTGRTDLRYLTLVSYGERASIRLRPARAWCPACYHDARQLGHEGYDQVRWACASVLSCDIHGGLLWFACPHCGARQPWQALDDAEGDLEYCSSCRRWLGGGAGATAAPALPARERNAAAACPRAERPLVLDDVLACAYRLRPGPPRDEPMPSFSAFVEAIDAANAFYRHLLAQLRRRWAVEHASLWDTLGPASGLNADHVREGVVLGRPHLRHLACRRLARAGGAPHCRCAAPPGGRTPARGSAPHARTLQAPKRPAARSLARPQLGLMWRLAAEQLRELEQRGQRLYPPAVTYQEWLPSWTPPHPL
jgi:hypothetical protein